MLPSATRRPFHHAGLAPRHGPHAGTPGIAADTCRIKAWLVRVGAVVRTGASVTLETGHMGDMGLLLPVILSA